MLRQLTKSVVGISLVALAICGAFFPVALHKRTQARELLRNIVELKLGSSTFSDAQSLRERFGGQPWNGPLAPASCSSESCDLRFVYTNSPLSYVPGVRRVEFVASIRVNGGLIVSREIDYTLQKASYFEYAYLMDEGLKSAESYEMKKLKVDAQGNPHVIKVSLGPLATSDQRSQAYVLDLSCLAKLGGCRNPSSIFPPRL
jgi:hypothetical protein